MKQFKQQLIKQQVNGVDSPKRLSSHRVFVGSVLGAGLMFIQTVSLGAEACVTLNKTTDVAGHSCCILPPPDKLEVSIENNTVNFSSSSSITWLPLSGSLNGEGNITMQGSSTVAGFPNISTTFSGNQSGSMISGTFTVGAEGGLPEGQPIVYDVSIDTQCSSSACIGTFKDTNMEIIIDSELKGTVTGPGLTGDIFAVHEYDTPGNVCFLSAIVKLAPNSCDVAVAGRLEITTVDGVEQGEFDFGGGNSCSGVVAPFTLNLPKMP